MIGTSNTINPAEYVNTSNADVAGIVGGIAPKCDAKFIFFSPKNFVDVIRRPYQFNFDDEIRNELAGILDRKRKGGATPTATNRMMHIPSGLTAIRPTTQFDQLGVSRMSDYWTFIMIVDNLDDAANSFGLTNTYSMRKRTIYSGYIQNGEPVSVNGAINNDAIFVFTHKSGLMTSANLNKIPYSMTDMDYVPVDTMLALTSIRSHDGLYQSTPEALAKSIVPGAVNTSNYFNGPSEDGAIPGALSWSVTATPLTPGEKSIKIKNDANSPSALLGSINNNIVRSVMTAEMDARQKGALFVGADVVTTMDDVLDNFVGGATYGTADRVILPDRPYSFSELLSIMPMNISPENVIRVNTAKESQVDSYLPTAPSKRNILSSIIQSSITAYMVTYNLTDIAFEYNSTGMPYGSSPVTGNIMDPSERGTFETFNTGTFYPMTDAMAMQYVMAFYDDIKRNLFPIIQSQGGDFMLYLSASISGQIHLNLVLLEEGLFDRQFVEVPLVLGGLHSPLITDRSIYNNNIDNLYGLIENSAFPVSNIIDKPLNYAAPNPFTYENYTY